MYSLGTPSTQHTSMLRKALQAILGGKVLSGECLGLSRGRKIDGLGVRDMRDTHGFCGEVRGSLLGIAGIIGGECQHQGSHWDKSQVLFSCSLHGPKYLAVICKLRAPDLNLYPKV